MATLINAAFVLDYNSGIGFLPVSLFVYMGNPQIVSRDMFTFYDEIKDRGCHDIIFCGSVGNYKDELSWIIPKLTSEGYFVSVFFDIEKAIPILARRIILQTDLRRYEKFKHLVNSLTENDMLLIAEQDIRKIVDLREELMEKTEAMLCFNEAMIPRETVLRKKIYDLIPITFPMDKTNAS